MAWLTVPLCLSPTLSEVKLAKTTFITCFEDGGTQKQKRKHAESADDLSAAHKSTVMSVLTWPPISKYSRPQAPVSSGCTWSEYDWSCAYDCAIMTVFYAYHFFSPQCWLSWWNHTPLNKTLAQHFDGLLSSPMRMSSCQEYNNIQDGLRDILSDRDPNHFLRHGPVGAPVDLIFDYIGPQH